MVFSSNPLIVQVAKHDQWSTNQPRIGADVLPPTPARILITGPSGSGKTQLEVDMLTRPYIGSWERIYVFSPSVHLDSVWNQLNANLVSMGGQFGIPLVNLERLE